MSVVLVAELERQIDPDVLAGALDAAQRRHPLLRARIDVVEGEPVFVEVAGAIPLTVLPLGHGEAVPIHQLLVWPFEPAPSPAARCFSLPVDGRDRSVVVVMVHHAMLDGKAGMRLAQDVLRWVDTGGAGIPLAPGAVPPPLHERFPPELRASRRVLDVLAQVREEREGTVAPTAFPFHARDVTTCAPRYDTLVLPPDATRRLLREASAAGASVTGVLAAALLQSAAALFDTDASRALLLASATDLRTRVDPPLPEDDAMVAIGMLCTPYLVSEESSTLARDIGDQIAREVARGESHLFYRFARTASFTTTDAGLEAFARWAAGLPQNLTLSNLGVVAHADDPSWVRRLSVTMIPGPNQVAFVTATTYRSELVIGVATDTAKLPAPLAERLVAGIAERLGADRPYEASPATVAATMLVPRRSPTRPDSMRFMT